MATAAVQSVGAFGNNVSSVTTSAITTATGNLLHVDSAAYSAAAHAMAVTDSAGRTYTNAIAAYLNTPALIYCQADYAKNITGGSNTFTLSLGGSGYPAIGVIEISGADTTSPLDLAEFVAQSVASGSPTFTTSGTTSQANEIAIACISEDASGTVVTEASGWTTQYDSYAGNLTRIHNATKVLSGTGTVTYNPTFSISWPYSIQICTYKAAGGAGNVLSRYYYDQHIARMAA